MLVLPFCYEFCYRWQYIGSHTGKKDIFRFYVFIQTVNIELLCVIVKNMEGHSDTPSPFSKVRKLLSFLKIKWTQMIETFLTTDRKCLYIR
jgi:hypothetical protein